MPKIIIKIMILSALLLELKLINEHQLVRAAACRFSIIIVINMLLFCFSFSFCYDRIEILET